MEVAVAEERDYRTVSLVKPRGMSAARFIAEIEGRRHLCGELSGYEEENGTKVLVVTENGKSYRIPREAVLKANLVYDL